MFYWAVILYVLAAASNPIWGISEFKSTTNIFWFLKGQLKSKWSHNIKIMKYIEIYIIEIPWKLHVNRWEVAPLFRCNLCSSLQQLGVRFLPCPLLSSDRLCFLQDSKLLQECQMPYKETSEAVSLANLHNKMRTLYKIWKLRFRP